MGDDTDGAVDGADVGFAVPTPVRARRDDCGGGLRYYGSEPGEEGWKNGIGGGEVLD